MLLPISRCRLEGLMDKSFSAGALSEHEKISRYVTDLFKPEDAVLKSVRTRSDAAEMPDRKSVV